MPIEVPSDAGDSGIKKEPKKLPKEETKNRSVLERISSNVDAVRSAFSGADIPIEFPELEEVTNIKDDSIDFFDVLLSSPAIFVRDDRGKLEVFQEIFKGDDRFGGAFEDKFGLPMIVWNDVPYYVNKPGLSDQDLNTFLGEVLKYMPASKFVSGAKTIKSTAGRGAVSYGATETGSEAFETFLTPETTAAKDRTLGDVASDVGTITAIGVGADVVVPPVAKGVTYGAREAGKRIGDTAARVTERVFPRLDPEFVSQSKYPLTQGQRLALPPRGITPQETPQLSLEEELRRTASGDAGTDIIRTFDEDQLRLIMADALALFEEFEGQIPGMDDTLVNVPLTAAERAAEIVSGRAEALKEQGSAAYEAVKAVDPPPFMSRQGVYQTADDLLQVLRDEDVALSQLPDFPALQSAVTNLRRVRKAAQNPRFKNQELSILHGYQKRLGRSINAAVSAEEKRILSLMKARLDEALYNGIERGILIGDQEVLDQLQNATGLYKDYMTLRGKSGGKNLNKADNAANALLEMLSAGNYTGPQVSSFLFGHHKFNPNQAVPIMLDKLEKVLPPNEYAAFVANVKNGILTKAVTNPQGFVSRRAIVNNFDDVFVKQRAIINKLFTPEELANLKQFRDDVLPTLWAETVGNPSRSATTMLAALGRRNLLQSVPVVRKFTSDIEAGMAKAEKSAQARDATRQKVRNLQLPALSQSAQSTLRILLDEQAEEADGIELPEETRQMLNDQLQDIEDQPPMVDEDISEDPIAMRPAPAPSPMQMPSFDPLPQTSAPMGLPTTPLSPDLLPSEEDREIAMRRQQGIAGLMA